MKKLLTLLVVAGMFAFGACNRLAEEPAQEEPAQEQMQEEQPTQENTQEQQAPEDTTAKPQEETPAPAE